MAYIKDVWRFPDSIETEYKFAGRYGAKGEKRAPRVKPTPEQVARQNQLNKEKKVRRLIKANFNQSDYWVTFKYPKGTRLPIKQVQKDLAKCLGKLRREYKKLDEQLKFIYRIEIGSRGGAHVHAIINRPKAGGADLLIQDAWRFGRANFEHLHNAGGYADLAAYLVKPPSVEAQKHIDALPEEERKDVIKYSPSRNLVRPEPERKEYSHTTMRRIMEDGPVPTPGYYIDYDSLVTGVNLFTGMSYMHYTELKLEAPKRGRPRTEPKVFENY